MSKEKRFVPPPRSTHQPAVYTYTYDLEERRTVEVLPIPQDMIIETVVNKDALKFLDQSSQWVIDPDHILSRARLTNIRSFRDDPTTFAESQLVPDTFGRAIIEGYTHVWYGKKNHQQLGKALIGKGVGLSGRFYHRDTSASLRMEHESSAKNPIGLYGSKEARKEIQITNGLIEAGVRSGLCCGFLVLDAEKVSGHIQRMFERLLSQVDPIYHAAIFQDMVGVLTAIDTVLYENKDCLVYLSRLVGTTERVLMGERSKVDQSVQRTISFFRYGCAILAQELRVNRVKTKSRTNQDRLDKGIMILELIATGKELNFNQYVFCQSFFQHLIMDDIILATNAVQKGLCGPYDVISFLSEFGNTIDTEFSLKHVDFEEAYQFNRVEADRVEQIKLFGIDTCDRLMEPILKILFQIYYR